MARFGAVLTAMVTPFDEAGRLDGAAAAELARWLVAHGNDGLVLAGSTGEASVLSDDEDEELVRAVRAAVDCPLVVGAGTNDTSHSVELVGRLSALGVDGILAVTPYYNRPSQAGLEAHFRAVAAATDLPVMLYDIPARSGRKIDTATLLRLAEVPNIVALKDAAGNPAETARFIAEAPEGFEVYSGDDTMTLPLLAVGAVGVVGVATHWVGRSVKAMLDAWEKKDPGTAQAINARLQEALRFQSSDAAPNPVPAKAMLRTLGLAVGECRLPMGPAPAGLEEAAQRLVAEYGLPA